MLDETKIRELINKLADVYRNDIDSANAVATGKLKNFTVDYDTDTTGLSVYYTLPFYWKYAPETKYNNKNLPTYESGIKKPPYAMVKALESWLEIKGLPYNAWAVATDIANDGWKDEPKQLLHTAIRKTESDTIIDEICNVYLDSIEEEIEL